MKTYLITFRSVTLAQRAQKLLERHAMGSNLRRTPRWMEERGCGYALEVKLPDAQTGTRVLEEEGIVFRKIYRVTPDGTVEALG